MEKQILTHFQNNDEKMYALAKKIGIIPVLANNDPFSDLCNAIVCQQLSDKAGAAIWKRFEALFSKKKITPNLVLKKSVADLRKSGISNSKAQYIQNIAEAFVKNNLHKEKFLAQTDEEVIQELIQIKGVGRWTSEMFLIFSLGRPDVFSAGDLGLRKGVQKLYGLRKLPEEKQLFRIAKKWSPYRSYASLLLWKSLD